MAKIFLAHSKYDEELKDFFLRAFVGANVHPFLKEYDDAPPPQQGQPLVIRKNIAEEIEEDILMSNALFVLLSETVQQLPNTAQWLVYEAAHAKAKKKPVWVFEPFDSLRRVDITIPYFNHLVRFRMDDDWRRYIRTIATSYHEKTVLMTSGAALAGLSVGGPAGGLIGGLLGYFLSNPIATPQGFGTGCSCGLTFEVHLPGGKGEFICRHCKREWIIN